MIRTVFAELRRRHVYRVAVAYAVVGWLLIEVSSTVFPVFDAPAWVLRVIIGVIMLGFPVALLLAWAFEVTPDGVRRTEAAEPSDASGAEPRRKVGRSLDALTVVLLVVAIAIMAGQRWRSPPRPSPVVKTHAHATTAGPVAGASSVPAKSIAVLPFANLSGDTSQQYFSDGISEDLLNLLARIPQLQVTARTSSFWFRGKDYTIPQIARKLRVAYILEGSVQKAGDEVRVSVQLVDAASDTQRWSQTYDRQLKDVFKIQDEIGADVVKQLRVRLMGSAPTVKQVDPKAYRFYLQGRLLSYQGTVKTLDQSDALYHQALAIDPRYAAAWIGLAQNAINRPWIGNYPLAQGFGLARSYIRKALAIDPDNAVGQSVLGYLATFERFDFDAAAMDFKRALALDSDNPDVLLNVGKFLFVINRPRQALAVFDRAKRLDPLNPDIDNNIAYVLIQQDRLKQAAEVLRKAHQLSPENAQIPFLISWVDLGMGQPKKAVADFPDHVQMLPSILCAAGRHAEAMKRLHEMIRHAGSRPSPIIGSIFADCGDMGKAFEWLDKSVGQKSRVVPYTVYGISFSKYHDDPRWKAYLRKVGFDPGRLAKIKFDVKLPATEGAGPRAQTAR